MAASSSGAARGAPIVSTDSIKVIAESVGIAKLKDEVAEALAPDVEYRLRDLVQEAIKFMKHGRRDTLTTDDINYALRLRNCEVRPLCRARPCVPLSLSHPLTHT